jgi:non-heme chloroperoxidase
MTLLRIVSCTLLLACLGLNAQAEASPSEGKSTSPTWHDPSPHKVQLISVEKDAQVEVLDWGGSGRNVVLVAGLGNTAHIFDNFAPKLSEHFHVYGITRRGFGQSSSPAGGYGAQRLGDDVVAVLDALKISTPILIGHSIGGEELSSVATHHPGRVAGLVYLDAAYSYAFYDREHGDYLIDLGEVINTLKELQRSPFDTSQMKAVQEKLTKFQHNLAEIQTRAGASGGTGPTSTDRASFRAMQSYMAGVVGGMPPESELHQTFLETPTGGVGAPRGQSYVSQAITAGVEKVTELHIPTLAIFVAPHQHAKNKAADAAQVAAAEASDKASTELQAKAFQSGVPQAHVVIIPNQNHYVFISDEANVLRLITEFISGLPPS